MKLRVSSLALCAMVGAGAVHAEDMTIADGVYTEDQAQRGKDVYEEHCKSCHAPDFYEDKLAAWQSEPLAGWYDVISFSMPQSMPGGLPPEDYTDVVAYILSLLDYPAGDSELSHEDGSLADITIVNP